MCELFGVSSSAPAVLTPLLLSFAERGGKTADNPDGWGLAYLGNEGLLLDKTPEAAAGSHRFRQLAHTLRSSLVIGHVRKANPPTGLTPANTHPFIRECCGKPWVFAHNGVVATTPGGDGCCRLHQSQPLGDTDSEVAFCFLLEAIAPIFAGESHLDRHWLRTIAHLSECIAQHGRFNFLLSDGQLLLAYGHDRLHLRHESDATNRRAIIATEPLTGDRWERFRPGTLQVFRAGERVAGID